MPRYPRTPYPQDALRVPRRQLAFSDGTPYGKNMNVCGSPLLLLIYRLESPLPEFCAVTSVWRLALGRAPARGGGWSPYSRSRLLVETFQNHPMERPKSEFSARGSCVVSCHPFPAREGDAPARGAGAAVRTVRGSRTRRTATRATGGEGHTHWHACGARCGEG
jgi:hypothetical protein